MNEQKEVVAWRKLWCYATTWAEVAKCLSLSAFRVNVSRVYVNSQLTTNRPISVLFSWRWQWHWQPFELLFNMQKLLKTKNVGGVKVSLLSNTKVKLKGLSSICSGFKKKFAFCFQSASLFVVSSSKIFITCFPRNHINFSEKCFRSRQV